MPILLLPTAAQRSAGQGIVAETFNLYALEGYSRPAARCTSSRTTRSGSQPIRRQGRSTRHSTSDLAKGFDTPIIHVNGDDPEAAMSAVRLALAYRARFGHDVVIDLVGYRQLRPQRTGRAGLHAADRHGGPDRQPPDGTRALRRKARRARRDDRGRACSSSTTTLRRASTKPTTGCAPRSARRSPPSHTTRSSPAREGPGRWSRPAVGAKRLRRLTQRLMRVPDGLHDQSRSSNASSSAGSLRSMTAGSTGVMQNRSPSASLLRQGVPVRLTGQDTERGTFSHRHLVFHDVRTGEIEIPMQGLKRSKASFEVYNSPLSEYSCVGFEYGYSTAAPEALVLWEAQFKATSRTVRKRSSTSSSPERARQGWKQTSRLTLLLPHGYEGNGPEHLECPPRAVPGS